MTGYAASSMYELFSGEQGMALVREGFVSEGVAAAVKAVESMRQKGDTARICMACHGIVTGEPFACECGLAWYCSGECRDRDRRYHDRWCRAKTATPAAAISAQGISERMCPPVGGRDDPKRRKTEAESAKSPLDDEAVFYSEMDQHVKQIGDIVADGLGGQNPADALLSMGPEIASVLSDDTREELLESSRTLDSVEAGDATDAALKRSEDLTRRVGTIVGRAATLAGTAIADDAVGIIANLRKFLGGGISAAIRAIGKTCSAAASIASAVFSIAARGVRRMLAIVAGAVRWATRVVEAIADSVAGLLTGFLDAARSVEWTEGFVSVCKIIGFVYSLFTHSHLLVHGAVAAIIRGTAGAAEQLFGFITKNVAGPLLDAERHVVALVSRGRRPTRGEIPAQLSYLKAEPGISEPGRLANIWKAFAHLCESVGRAIMGFVKSIVEKTSHMFDTGDAEPGPNRETLAVIAEAAGDIVAGKTGADQPTRDSISRKLAEISRRESERAAASREPPDLDATFASLMASTNAVGIAIASSIVPISWMKRDHLDEMRKGFALSNATLINPALAGRAGAAMQGFCLDVDLWKDLVASIDADLARRSERVPELVGRGRHGTMEATTETESAAASGKRERQTSESTAPLPMEVSEAKQTKTTADDSRIRIIEGTGPGDKLTKLSEVPVEPKPTSPPAPTQVPPGTAAPAAGGQQAPQGAAAPAAGGQQAPQGAASAESVLAAAIRLMQENTPAIVRRLVLINVLGCVTGLIAMMISGGSLDALVGKAWKDAASSVQNYFSKKEIARIDRQAVRTAVMVAHRMSPKGRSDKDIVISDAERLKYACTGPGNVEQWCYFDKSLIRDPRVSEFDWSKLEWRVPLAEKSAVEMIEVKLAAGGSYLVKTGGYREDPSPMNSTDVLQDRGDMDAFFARADKFAASYKSSSGVPTDDDSKDFANRVVDIMVNDDPNLQCAKFYTSGPNPTLRRDGADYIIAGAERLKKLMAEAERQSLKTGPDFDGSRLFTAIKRKLALIAFGSGAAAFGGWALAAMSGVSAVVRIGFMLYRRYQAKDPDWKSALKEIAVELLASTVAGGLSWLVMKWFAYLIGRTSEEGVGWTTGLLDAAVLALMGFLLLLVIGEIKSNQQRGFFLLIGLPQPPPAR